MTSQKDKTLNTLRLLSNKEANVQQGSLVTNGGVYVGGNIMSDQNIFSDNLIAKGSCKIAGDLNVGGNIYSPSTYNINGDSIRYRKKILPDRSVSANNDPLTIGSYKEPWETVFTQKIKTSEIDTVCINSPSFQVDSLRTNIVSSFNIIDPKTNCIYFKACGTHIDSYCPIYQQWKSFRNVEIKYEPDKILHITTSDIFLEVGSEDNIVLFYNADLVPNFTKIKTYFFNNNISTNINYKLTVTRFNKMYVYTSKLKVKNIKLYFNKDLSYFLS